MHSFSILLGEVAMLRSNWILISLPFYFPPLLVGHYFYCRLCKMMCKIHAFIQHWLKKIENRFFIVKSPLTYFLYFYCPNVSCNCRREPGTQLGIQGAAEMWVLEWGKAVDEQPGQDSRNLWHPTWLWNKINKHKHMLPVQFVLKHVM